MKGLVQEGQEVPGRGDPVGKPTNGDAGAVDFLPNTNKAYPEGVSESVVECLRNDVQVGD